MSIRYKTSLLLGVVLIGIFLLNIILAWGYILPSFGKIEVDRAETNLSRILEAYNNEFESINSKVADWACWDDAYDYIGGSDNGFIEENLVDAAFENIKVDFIIFTNSAGEIVYQGGYDYEKDETIEDFSGWDDHLNKNDLLTDYDENKSKMGLIFITGKPILFGSHPILTSNAIGPSRGTLIFGKYLSTEEIQKLASLTKLDLKIESVSQVSDQADKAALDSLTATGNQFQVVEMSSDMLRGYSLIKDYYNQPALLIRANLVRDIYNQGLQAVKYFIFNLAFGSVVVLLLARLLLEFLVLRRILTT